jgi:hypothetical protein
MRSVATARGSSAGSRCTPPASGTMPTLSSGRKNSACSAATIRSQASTISKPPPTAIPFTAAITGLSRSNISVSPANPPGPKSVEGSSSPAAAALEVHPAEKKRSPAPVKMPTLS